MARPLVPLPVPAGDRVLGLLPVLTQMLRGDGPALLPMAESAADAAVLALAGDLGPDEDDDADPTGLVVATSGSTGSPKGALLPASALRASAAATELRLATPGAQWLLALPADHIAGLQVLLRSVAAGTEPVVLGDSPFTAARFTTAVERMGPGPRLVSLVPTQLHRILQDPQAAAAAKTFDAILLGGAAADPRLLERAAGLRLVTTYGMSETGGGCVYDGVPLDGTTVHLEDDVVVLGGNTVARGYRNRPGDPAFRSADGRRSFRTSDLGRLDDGRLTVLGRADDVLITGGVKISPAEVEAILLELPEIEAALVTAVPDPEWGEQLVALVVTGSRETGLADRVARAAGRLHPAAVPRVVMRVDELPLRGIGKPDRLAARTLARSLLGSDPGAGTAERGFSPIPRRRDLPTVEE